MIHGCYIFYYDVQSMVVFYKNLYYQTFILWLYVVLKWESDRCGAYILHLCFPQLQFEHFKQVWLECFYQEVSYLIRFFSLL
jgi:hypothetical protein